MRSRGWMIGWAVLFEILMGFIEEDKQMAGPVSFEPLVPGGKGPGWYTGLRISIFGIYDNLRLGR